MGIGCRHGDFAVFKLSAANGGWSQTRQDSPVASSVEFILRRPVLRESALALLLLRGAFQFRCDKLQLHDHLNELARDRPYSFSASYTLDTSCSL
jgi:hypothetical protein